MDIVEKSFRMLYPERELNCTTSLKYSGKFSDYNANVQLRGSHIEIKMSRKWEMISEEIRIGLVQELLLKMLGGKKQSMYIDLYNEFIKNLHIAIPKDNIEPFLGQSFDRVNDKYFLGMVEKPNLRWAGASKTKLGTYDFKKDEISISQVFRKIDLVYLDFVMYHEILHKCRKFESKNGRGKYHDRIFREKEKMFEGHEQLEKELNKKLRYLKIKGIFFD